MALAKGAAQEGGRQAFPLMERVLGVGRGSLVRGAPLPLSTLQIFDLLGAQDGSELEQEIYDYADSVTEHFFGKKVFLRGIVEFSNVCEKNCEYCGIRRDMPIQSVKRYTMTKEEIVECAMWAQEKRLGTFMMQSGEITSKHRLEWVQDVVRTVRERSIAADTRNHRGLAVALSIGELPLEEYKKLVDAGARRYLLRIETSNPMLYRTLHPHDGHHEWEKRLECLRDLRRAGLQVGTGVMIGLPGQSRWDLAHDVSFLRDVGADMVGMGPYVVQDDTPTGHRWHAAHAHVDKQRLNTAVFNISTRMLALTRIVLGDANISATTALQAINPVGRELALRRGANMMMPILTPTKYREAYQLYQGKPSVHEAAEDSLKGLEQRILAAKKEASFDDWGDPPHFLRAQAEAALHTDSSCTC